MDTIETVKSWPKPLTNVEFDLSPDTPESWCALPGLPVTLRPLGLGKASDEVLTANTVRISAASDALAHGWPCAETSFHLLYILKGRVDIRTEAGERIVLNPGDCIHQPGLFRRNVFAFAPGTELMEMTAAADRLPGVVAPAHEGRPVIQYDVPEAYKVGDGPRRFFAYRDLGVTAVTDRKMHIHIVRAVAVPEGGTGWHYHTMSQLFAIFTGWARLGVQGRGEVLMNAGDAMCIRAGMSHNVSGFSPDYSLIEVCMPADYDTVDVPPQP